MRTSRPIRTRWVTPALAGGARERHEPKPALESETLRRARRLPLPGPGIVITVKLDLLPAYLELHHLEPLPRMAAIGELPDPILKVKRSPKEGK